MERLLQIKNPTAPTPKTDIPTQSAVFHLDELNHDLTLTSESSTELISFHVVALIDLMIFILQILQVSSHVPTGRYRPLPNPDR